MRLRPKDVIATLATLTSISIVSIALRLWINKTYGRRRWTYSDYFLILEAIIQVPLAVVTVVKLLEPFANISNDTTISEPKPVVWGSIVTEPILFTELWLAKASLVAMYYDSYGSMSRKLKLTWWLVAWWTFITYLVTTVGAFLTCLPTDRLRLPPTSPDFCRPLNQKAMLIYYICTITTDFMIILFPIALFRQLKIRRKTLHASFFVFFVGIISVIAATCRFAFTWGPLASTQSELDFITRSSTISFWTIMEVFCAVFASCLPAFRVFLRPKAPTSRASSDGMLSALRSFKHMMGARKKDVDEEDSTELHGQRQSSDKKESLDPGDQGPQPAERYRLGSVSVQQCKE